MQLVVVQMKELMTAVSCWRRRKKVCKGEREELNGSLTT
jgi:hypothetical protein